MSKQFIPPIELGQFAPSAAAISSWLYQLWKYLQDNPIPDVEDVERVTAKKAQDYIEEYVPTEVQRAFAEALENLDYNDIVGPDSTIPVYRAANDEISQADLAEAYAEGCRFAIVDDSQVYAMLRNGETIVLLPINPVTSVNGRTGAVLVGESNSINLAVAGWNTTTKEMTVIAIGVTANNNVIVSPNAASFDDWTSCGVRCIAQANGQLTFYCDTVPSTALTANYMFL